MQLKAAGGIPVVVGTRLLEAVAAALSAATISAGLVDPTIGRTLRLAGYDRTFSVIRRRDGSLVRPSFVRDPNWRTVVIDETRQTVRVAEGVFFHRRALDQISEQVRSYLAAKQQMTAAEFRDLIGSTRKYAVPLLEWLDQARVTRRVGDARILF